jgi:hypothetical protein
MKGLLRFLSLTSATQLCLLASQLLLLPLQLRIWGHETTAQWLVVMAVANIASIADLGLRNAAHAQLIAAVRATDIAAAKAFGGVWMLTRLLFAGVVLALIAAQLLFQILSHQALALWQPLLILTLGLETLLIVRGVWLDSLGHFNTVEATFLAMVASRVALSIAALAFFGAAPMTLALIFLLTAIGTIAGQEYWLRRLPLLGIFAGNLRDIGWNTTATLPLVASEPALNWLRLSLPVIVFAAIADPLFVTSYVALRAIFGMARQVTSQLARYASIIYVQQAGSDRTKAEQIALSAILACTLVGAGVAGLVLADHGRLLSLWLANADPGAASGIAASFAVTVAVFGYQVLNSILTRRGDIQGTARRNYVYIATSLAAAALAIVAHSVPAYLVLLALPEVIIALLYATAFSANVFRIASTHALAAIALLGLLWLAVVADPFGRFASPKLSDIALCMVLGLLPAALIAAFAIPRQSVRLREGATLDA